MTPETMHKVVKHFLTYGAPNSEDFIGPNKFDWDFFCEMGAKRELTQMDVYWCAKRLQKYGRTQVPLICEDLGIPLVNINDVYVATVLELAQDDEPAVRYTRYIEDWQSAKGYSGQTKRIIVKPKFGMRNDLYNQLSGRLGFPAFKYLGKHIGMSIKDDTDTIRKASVIINDAGFDTTQLLSMLEGAEVKEEQPQDYTVRLHKDAVAMYIPYASSGVHAQTRISAKSNDGKWLPDTKEWAVPLATMVDFLDEIMSFNAKLHTMVMSIEEVNNYVSNKAERIAISSAPSLSDESVVESMRQRLSKVFPDDMELYPFQYAGVRYGELSNGRWLIGDEMGLGKTVQAIAYMGLHPEQMPALIVSPAVVKYNWLKECKTWLSNVYTMDVVEKTNSPVPDTDIVIINYDLMAKQKDNLLGRFKTVVFDESHYLKNRGSKSKPVQRTKACIEVAEEAECVICLSGTAIPNRPIELWNIISMLRPTEWKGKWQDYVTTYCDGYRGDFGWVVDGASNQDELHKKTRDFMIRRLKKEVLPDLPDKVRQYPVVTPDADMLKEYRKAAQTWSRGMKNENRPPGYVLNMLTDLRNRCGEMKAEPAARWALEYLEQNDTPIIVYSHHLKIHKMIENKMNEMRQSDMNKGRTRHNRALRIATIDGSVAPKKRQEIVESFQNNELDVLLCSTIAAGVGLTLTASDTVLFVEREWVPAHEEQAEDRVSRIGAEDKDTVWAVYLTVENTIDAKFNRIVESKRKEIKAILDGGEIWERTSILNDLLKAMVDSGELPKDVLSEYVEGDLL